MQRACAVLLRCSIAVGLMSGTGGVMGQSSAIAAAEVADFITTLGNQALEVLHSSATPSQKIAYFQQLLREDFDLPGISRFVLGPYWRVASEAQRQEFQNLLPDYLVRSTGRRFGNYNAEAFQVTGTRSEPPAALVTSQLIQAGGPPIQLIWRLEVRGDRYKIIDVNVDGVSMALTVRESLASMIQRNGGQVAGLLEAMRAGETGADITNSPVEVRWASAWTY
jgi:phospholipid transport system substrate-binding protein